MGSLLTLKIKKKGILFMLISQYSSVVYHLPVANPRLRITDRL